MIGTIAHTHLLIFATLNRTGAVAVKIVHIKNILVAVAAIPLFNANFSSQRIVFDVFYWDRTTVEWTKKKMTF